MIYHCSHRVFYVSPLGLQLWVWIGRNGLLPYVDQQERDIFLGQDVS